MEETVQQTKHVPVLFQETLELLALRPGMTAVDATLGGGGHARALLAAVGSDGKVIAIDRDEQALRRFEKNAENDPAAAQALAEGRLLLVHGNYSDLEELLAEAGIGSVNAILADLGFSSDQIEDPKRGLSFQKEGPLDMRLDQSRGRTAADILRESSEQELAQLFRDYGEEPLSARIAKAIVTARQLRPLETTHELAGIIEGVYPKSLRFARGIHPATKVFQALRIAVNEEGEHLEAFLAAAGRRLTPGGRLAIIAFHSGEDRKVKQFFRNEARGCVCPKGFPVCRCGQKPRMRILTKKPGVPSEEEAARNPRARSAKLRAAEKI